MRQVTAGIVFLFVGACTATRTDLLEDGREMIRQLDRVRRNLQYSEVHFSDPGYEEATRKMGSEPLSKEMRERILARDRAWYPTLAQQRTRLRTALQRVESDASLRVRRVAATEIRRSWDLIFRIEGLSALRGELPPRDP